MSDSYHGSNSAAVTRRDSRRKARASKRVYVPLNIDRLNEQLHPVTSNSESRSQNFSEGYTGAAV